MSSQSAYRRFGVFVQQYTFTTIKVGCMNDWKNFRVTEHRKSYQEKYEKREWKDDRNEE